MEESFTLEGRVYTRVPRARADSNGEVSVYRSHDTYLRLGEPVAIERYLQIHESLMKQNFPVAEVLSIGMHKEHKYYIERSLGEKNFARLFAGDEGKPHHFFDEFLALTGRMLHAQIKTRIEDGDPQAFARGIHLETLCLELPEIAPKIRERFIQALGKMHQYPYVLTHGDFNPSNMYPAGVIDVENVFYAPLGFDPVTAVETATWFLRSPESESFAQYSFSEDEIKKFYDHCDTIFKDAGFPPLSMCKEEFAFCRGVWMTARMHKWPVTQKFRYEKFISRFLTS